MNKAASGARRERWLQQELREDPDCLEVTRCAASRGLYDLCAVMRDGTWFIQVKGHFHISPAERKALTVLSDSELHRFVWVVFVRGKECIWQMYLDEHNEYGRPQGWYLFPDGPFGALGERVKLREENK